MATTHDCNAYCRADTHAEVIYQWASGDDVAPLAPERWARLWQRELRRDLGEVLAVDFAREVEWPDEFPANSPHHVAAYLVTYRERAR